MATKRSSHLTADGRLAMVDVSDKDQTVRTARAAGHLRASPSTVTALVEATGKKGEALAAARLAGVMAAKKTGDLIPLCHPLPVTHVDVDFETTDDGIAITATVRTVGRTGVEMEALTAVSVAALTLYDMGKSVEKDMVIDGIRLLEKTGGKSGHWVRAAKPGDVD